MNIFDQDPCCEQQAQKSLQCVSPSMLDTLKRRQKDATERLNDLNAAISALESNPEVAKVLELVARAR
jgi:hypothetical protein